MRGSRRRKRSGVFASRREAASVAFEAGAILDEAEVRTFLAAPADIVLQLGLGLLVLIARARCNLADRYKNLTEL